MNRPVSLYIGLRYLLSKRSDGFLSFISIFSIGGMALGVFSLVLVLSVMNGFDDELKRRILRAIPHGVVDVEGGVKDWRALSERIKQAPRVVGVSPYIGGNALMANGSLVKGAQLRGVDPDIEGDVSPIKDYFVSGDFTRLQSGEFGIVLGRLLSYSIGANVGDKVLVTIPQVSISLAGVFPRARRFTVVGIFEAGAQIDQTLSLIHLNDAQKLFRKGDFVDGIRVKFDDIYAAAEGMQSIAGELGSQYSVHDWSQTQGTLFQAVKLEKTVTGLLLSIIIAVAAFNIITSLIMMVTEKRSEIAVLRTMGLRRGQVMMIFVTQGCFTGFMGVFIGVFLGVPCAVYLPEIVSALESILGKEVFDPNVYFVTSIPSIWLVKDTVWVCLLGVLTSFLATLYPSYRTSLIEPSEAIRYNV